MHIINMMDDGSIRFERDRTKAEANWIKHGVSFEEAAEAFGDARGKIIDDPRSLHRCYALRPDRHEPVGASACCLPLLSP